MRKKLCYLVGCIILGLTCMTGCSLSGGKDINQEVLKSLAGSYHMVASTEKDAYTGMALSIVSKSEETKKPYLSIYDTVGTPGVEGRITSITEDSIVVDVNQEYYDLMPASDWKLDGNNLVLSYNIEETSGKNTQGMEITVTRITLTDASGEGRNAITFEKELVNEDGEYIDTTLVDVDETVLKSIAGTYYSEELKMSMFIQSEPYERTDWEENYDNFIQIGTGDDGFCEGSIVYLDEGNISLKYFYIGYLGMPNYDFWKEEGSVIKFTYERKGDSLILTNNKNSVTFMKK